MAHHRTHRRRPLAWSDKHGVFIAPATPAKPPFRLIVWDTAKGLLLIPGLLGNTLRLGLGLIGWALVFLLFGLASQAATWLQDFLLGWMA